MSDSTDTESKRKRNPPEQTLGDTPVPPWEMPTPEEKEQARPVRRALKEAIRSVDSPAKADEVLRDLETVDADQTVKDVEDSRSPYSTTAAAARNVEEAARAAPESQKTGEVLHAAAKALATPDKRQREVVSEAVQEVINPEQQGAAPTAEDEQKREYLRQALLNRLTPLDALDANLFLMVNHLPHTRLLNRVFYGLTVAFNGGAAWYVLLTISALRNPHRFGELVRQMALPLTIATALVEFPVKAYFRRRRPFITLIQAIVIGKKPGTWSFPSGHSASAFGGAWLLNRQFPRLWGLRYVVASLVAFSRIYLGDHYPGDVASGSLLGMLFAMSFRKLFNWRNSGRR
jgi:membrane-associated phospholipid phosphatase